MKQFYKFFKCSLLNPILQKISLIIIVSVLFLPLACSKKDANYYYKQGNIKFRQKAYDDAINLYTQAVKISPDYEEAFYSRAFCYTKKQDYKKALEDFKKVIEINQDNADAYINRAFYALEPLGDYAGALNDYNKSISLLSKTSSAFALNNRGYAKFMLNDTIGAIEDINQSLEIDPENPYAYRNRALLNFARGFNAEGCKDLLLAKDRGFEQLYGREIDELLAKHCK